MKKHLKNKAIKPIKTLIMHSSRLSRYACPESFRGSVPPPVGGCPCCNSRSGDNALHDVNTAGGSTIPPWVPMRLIKLQPDYNTAVGSGAL